MISGREDVERMQVDGGNISLQQQDIVYDVKDQDLDPFNNEVSSAVLKPCFGGLDRNDVDEGGGSVKQTVMWLERLDAWVATGHNVYQRGRLVRDIIKN